MKCFSCQKEVAIQEKVGRREECSHCHADLHVCKNCEFYDKTAYNECHESSADRVQDKERSNFCDYFSPSSKAGTKSNGKDDLLKAAEALFKK